VPIYPQAARDLLDTCREYREQVVSLASIKSAIWQTADEVVAVEDRPLRDFLQAAEGRLDVIEHITNDERIFDETLPVIEEVESRLREYLSG
jgi:hypothetical protein